jgi:hypothetical protein
MKKTKNNQLVSTNPHLHTEKIVHGNTANTQYKTNIASGEDSPGRPAATQYTVLPQFLLSVVGDAMRPKMRILSL